VATNTGIFFGGQDYFFLLGTSAGKTHPALAVNANGFQVRFSKPSFA